VALLGVVAVFAGVLLIAAEAALLTHTRVAAGWPDKPDSSLAQSSLAIPAVKLSDVSSQPRAARAGNHPHRQRRAPRPVAIQVPAIGVRARVIRLGLNRDHTLQVPSKFSDTGWWAGGARPGERGPAVVVGHVDSYTGPAVYYRLRELRRGDRINIVRANRSVARFTVQRLGRYSKARFPTAQVYGPTRRPTLRLITCSGTFDRSTGHYLDNTVVFATLAGPG
jgi:hypothetical protein